LTDNANDARPRWSPDGSRIVFMSDGRDGNWDIYSVPVTDAGAGSGAGVGEVTRISFNAASDGLPAISPDGSEIAFVSNRGNQWGIWRVAIDSGRAVSVVGDLGALTNWLDHSIDWAP
jgi:Tol biopolymer transport system component